MDLPRVTDLIGLELDIETTRSMRGSTRVRLETRVVTLTTEAPACPVSPPDHGIDQLEKVLVKLPLWVQEYVLRYADVIEDVCLDVNRPLRFILTEGFVTFPERVSAQELRNLKNNLDFVASDNRSGIDGTLHRISLIPSRGRDGEGAPCGATVRLARVATGAAEPLREVLVRGGEPQSFVLLAPPRMGKTTVLRDCLRVIAEALGPALVCVDSSNEIAGFGDEPHAAIAQARRLQVTGPEWLDKMLNEAIKNHSARMVILDEIRTLGQALEVRQARLDGVAVGCTLHARSIRQGFENDKYAPVLGYVDVRSRQKPSSVSFDVIIEIHGRGRFVVYEDADETVTRALHGQPLEGRRVGRWSEPQSTVLERS